MFCLNCGEKIPDNSKFCYKCGTKIEISKDETQISDESGHGVLKAESEKLCGDMPTVAEFEIYGKKVIISEMDRKNLLVMGALIHGAKLGRNNILENIRYMEGINQISRLKDVIEREFGAFNEKIYDVLAENGISYKLKEDIRRLFANLDTLAQLSQLEREMAGQLAELQQDKNAAIRKNELKKQNRGRIVGGGFGLRGAAKGMLTASAVNSVTGSIYSIRNAFTNASINSKYNRMASSIPFKKDALCLPDAFFDDCMRIVDQVFSYVGKEKYRFKAGGYKKILKYIREIKGCSEEEFSRIPELFYEILCIYPFDENSYIEVCSRLGDDNGEVKNMLEYLNMDTADVDQALASYRFRNDLYGSYMERIKEEVDNKKLDWWYHHYLGYGINEYMEKGVDNIIPDAFDIMKAHLMKGEYCWHTFKFKKNMHLLQGFKSIDFTWQEPVSLYWEKEIADDYPKEHRGKYLLVTSENVYSPNFKIPVMEIFDVSYDKNAGIYINKKYLACGNIHCDSSAKNMLYSEILLLQLVHEMGKSDKRIPLFDSECVNSDNNNIYYAVKSIFLDADGGLSDEPAKMLSDKHYFVNGYLTSSGERLVKEKFLPNPREDEYFIMGFWKIEQSRGIILTNLRLLYIDFLYHVFEQKDIAEYKRGDFVCSYSGRFGIFGKEMFGSDKEKQDFYFCQICNQIIEELSGVQQEMPADACYDQYAKDKNDLTNGKRLDELANEKDMKVILKRLISQMLLDKRLGEYNVYHRGMLPEGKDLNRLSNYCLQSGEIVFLLKNMPLLNRPQKKGWVVTDQGIRLLTDQGLFFVAWENVKDTIILFSGERVVINDQISIDGAFNLGMILQEFSKFFNEPKIVTYIAEKNKFYYDGKEIDYKKFMEGQEYEKIEKC